MNRSFKSAKRTNAWPEAGKLTRWCLRGTLNTVPVLREVLETRMVGHAA